MALSSTTILIPARYSSSRFPGKPLASIKGFSLLYRVWRIARAVKNADEVYIATDDQRIADHVQQFGGQYILTPPAENGTERIYYGLKAIQAKPQLIINLQGDAVLTPPWVIEKLIKETRQRKSNFSTIAVALSIEQYKKLTEAKAEGEVGGTLVVMDKNHNALYFSKSMIPFLRKGSEKDIPLYRHIGVYAYSYAQLKKYLQLPVSPLEKAEGLEPLRALENQMPIRITCVDYRGRTHGSVDSPADIVRIEKIILEEGELITNLGTNI